MVDQVQLHPTDVRRLLRLLSQAQDRSVPPSVARERLLRGLCRLTKAQAGLCMHLRLGGDGHWQVVECDVFGWSDPRRRRAAAPLFTCGQPLDPMSVILGRRSQLVTLSRRQLIDDETWYAHPHVRQIRCRAGVDDCIYSLVRLASEGIAGCISVHRHWGHPEPFAPREMQLLHLLHGEIKSLYHKGDIPPGSPVGSGRLSLRQQQTLNLLLAGCSEKEAAERLGLSHHTVHVHVRGVYKRLGVNTRAELLSRFVTKDPPVSNAGQGVDTLPP